MGLIKHRLDTKIQYWVRGGNSNPSIKNVGLGKFRQGQGGGGVKGGGRGAREKNTILAGTWQRCLGGGGARGWGGGGGGRWGGGGGGGYEGW